MNLKLGCGQSLRYDMSGGAWDRIMGVLAYYEDDLPMSGNSTVNNSGFTGRVWQSGTYETFTNEPELAFPEIEYYNLYKVSTTEGEVPTSSSLSNSLKACNGGVCYGQALSETSGWYSDNSSFVSHESPWFVRGGYYGATTTNAGVFNYSGSGGGASNNFGSRFVLAP